MNDTAPAITPTAASDLVVVLLATFNGSRFLRQQLDSIAAQTHLHWQLIVADDGSHDDTLAIVQTFQEEHPDRVRIVRNDSVGSARDNFMRLLRLGGQAPYFAFCDQDDLWSYDKLERLVRRCQQTESQHRGQPCLVYSDLTVVDAQLAILNPSFLNQVRVRPLEITHRTLLTENAIPGCAMLFNDALANVFRARDFDQPRAIMHDWWMVLLAATLGHISYVPTSLVSYRQHDRNTLGSVNRSGLVFTLTKLFRGDRSTALATYSQAAAFLDAYDDLLDPAVGEEIRAFASLYHLHKFERIRLILKHRILKQTLSRRAYQLLRA